MIGDDGVGMDPEELAELRREIGRPCQETEKGFGLANVNERIRMYLVSIRRLLCLRKAKEHCGNPDSCLFSREKQKNG